MEIEDDIHIFVGEKEVVFHIYENPTDEEKEWTGIKKFGIVMLGEEKKLGVKDEHGEEEYGHDILATQNFEDIEDLRLAKMGLLILQQALTRNSDLHEELKKTGEDWEKYE